MYGIQFIHKKDALHKVPDALSRAFAESPKLAVLQRKAKIEPWYQRKLDAVLQNLKKFLHWRVENNLLYVYRPDRLINPLITDLYSWKLVLPSTERIKAIQEAHVPP